MGVGFLNRLCHGGLIADALQPGYEVDAVAFGDGWVAAAGSSPAAPGSTPAPATVLVLDTEVKTRMRAVLLVTGRVARLAAPAGGRRPVAVAADPRDGTHVLAAWEVPDVRGTGLQAPAFTLPCGTVWDLAPDGGTVASATPDGVVVRGTGPADAARVVRTGAGVLAVALGADGTRVATTGTGNVRVWDLGADRVIATWPAEARGLAIAWWPSGDGDGQSGNRHRVGSGDRMSAPAGVGRPPASPKPRGRVGRDRHGRRRDGARHSVRVGRHGGVGVGVRTVTAGGAAATLAITVGTPNVSSSVRRTLKWLIGSAYGIESREGRTRIPTAFRSGVDT